MEDDAVNWDHPTGCHVTPKEALTKPPNEPDVDQDAATLPSSEGLAGTWLTPEKRLLSYWDEPLAKKPATTTDNHELFSASSPSPKQIRKRLFGSKRGRPDEPPSNRPKQLHCQENQAAKQATRKRLFRKRSSDEIATKRGPRVSNKKGPSVEVVAKKEPSVELVAKQGPSVKVVSRKAMSGRPKLINEKKRGERRHEPFACDWPNCHKAFTRVDTLRVHRETVHQKVKRYRCECGSAYTSGSGLKYHLERSKNGCAAQLRRTPSSSPPLTLAKLRRATSNSPPQKQPIATDA